MHCILQIVTKGRPEMAEIYRIMMPYYEEAFYGKYYDPVSDSHRDIPPEDYPAFTWDYYTVWEEPKPSKDVEIGECFAIIDRQGRPHVRKYWNGGPEWIDQNQDFEYWVKRIVRERGPNDWVTTINYHY